MVLYILLSVMRLHLPVDLSQSKSLPVGMSISIMMYGIEDRNPFWENCK